MKDFFTFLILFFVLLFIISINSCNVTQLQDATTHYKMDMGIKNLNRFSTGMIVLEDKPLYTLEFSTSHKMDLFTFRTCSREVAVEKAKKGLNFKKFKVNYRPNLIEKRPGCPIELNAFDHKGRRSVGYIDTKDKYTTLKAMVICGAKTKLYEGVSVCQERSGLIQAITFETEVMVKPESDCDLGKNRGKNFEFEIKSGICVYAFMETEPPHQTHRLTTWGYDTILIRE